MAKYQVISADGHNEVPADRWLNWVPAQYRDRMPSLIKGEDGSEIWRIEAGGETWVRSTSGNAVGDWPYDEFTPQHSRYYREDGSRRPGTGDAIQRLQEQDLDGIDAEVLYPPVYSPIFFKTGWKNKDKDAYLAFIRGYNDFVANEYSPIAPDRLICMALVPETGVDDAIAEIERCRKMGILGVAMAQWPNGGPDYDPQDDRFFAASLEIGMKIAPHGTFGGVKISPPGSASLTRDNLFGNVGAGGPTYTIGQLIVNGVFDRFPDLRIYFAETQAGWLAHSLSWLDEFHRRWAWYVGAVPKRMPSEYYRDNCMFSFIVDRMAMQLRQYIPIRMLMWGTDFPHSVGSFPDSRRFVEDLFEGVPEDEKYQVLVGNPCEYFNLDPNKELTPTPQREMSGTASRS